MNFEQKFNPGRSMQNTAIVRHACNLACRSHFHPLVNAVSRLLLAHLGLVIVHRVHWHPICSSIFCCKYPSCWHVCRHHRYIFEAAEKKAPGEKEKSKRVIARLQELGPRFTLKLLSLQKGTFDSKGGEYEWVHNHKTMDTSRRRFFL